MPRHLIFLLGCTCLSFSILHSDTLSISANPATLTISTAIAGQQPTAVTNTSTTYSFSSLSLVTRTITGKISAAMPSNVTLHVQLANPGGGATSTGLVAMTTTAQNLVTGIPILGSGTGVTITYQLSATVSAAIVTGGTKTLTLTLQ
jgi:hypothetical protein